MGDLIPPLGYRGRYPAQEAFSLGNIGEPRDRNCPDCNTQFPSVQNTGICPSCDLVFDVDLDGSVLQRRGKIGDPPPRKLTILEQGVKNVRKCLRFLNADVITLDEFNDKMLLDFVQLPDECWDECALELPSDLTAQFVQYLDDYLTPVDHMPSPVCFMVGPHTPDRIQQKQNELRPTYRAIHDFWKRRS